MSLTKITNPQVIRIAAISAIIFSVIGKLSALLRSIPQAILGGIMLLLFGTIASVGVNNLIKNKVDLSQTRNIIIMTSLSGIKGLPGQTNYSAAKAALIGATKALAQEVAPRKITVNAIAPGFIETDMTKDLDQTTLKKLIPVGRFGKPEEVAELVAFLASEKSSYITGEVISINGGLYT